MKILVVGSSGLIGSALIPFLKAQGNLVKKLKREHSIAEDELFWDPEKAILDIQSLEELDAIINLTGENIADTRWTEAKKKKILESRVISTRLLCHAVSVLQKPPKIFINASAVGYYGNRGEEWLQENSASGSTFLAEVCRSWETSADRAKIKGVRVVKLRIGTVLSPKGGALAMMLPFFRWGLGGALGSGKQYMSWIAIDDLLSIIRFTLANSSCEDVINAVSPNPITNTEFTKALANILRKPALFSIPPFMLKLVYGEMADELLLSSVKVQPKRLLEYGYEFLYPTIDKALKHLITV